MGKEKELGMLDVAGGAMGGVIGDSDQVLIATLLLVCMAFSAIARCLFGGISASVDMVLRHD